MSAEGLSHKKYRKVEKGKSAGKSTETLFTLNANIKETVGAITSAWTARKDFKDSMFKYIYLQHDHRAISPIPAMLLNSTDLNNEITFHFVNCVFWPNSKLQDIVSHIFNSKLTTNGPYTRHHQKRC